MYKLMREILIELKEIKRLLQVIISNKEQIIKIESANYSANGVGSPIVIPSIEEIRKANSFR